MHVHALSYKDIKVSGMSDKRELAGCSVASLYTSAKGQRQEDYKFEARLEDGGRS